MTHAAATYFQHLRAYLNSDYVVDDGASGKVLLTETYFRPEDEKPKRRKVILQIPGVGIAFKLDNDDFENTKKKQNQPCFIF